MKLNDKIYTLRTSRGWSQEQLAMHMDVSRQSVAKWESGASSPELSKLIAIAKLFEVSLDELLLDERQLNQTVGSDIRQIDDDGLSDDQKPLMACKDEEPSDAALFSIWNDQDLPYSSQPPHQPQSLTDISNNASGSLCMTSEYALPPLGSAHQSEEGLMEQDIVSVNAGQVSEYLETARSCAATKARAIGLMVLSPALMMILLGFSEMANYLSDSVFSGLFSDGIISEDAASITGAVFLLMMNAIAIPWMISSDDKMKSWKWMKKKILDLDPEAAALTEAEKEEESRSWAQNKLIATMLMILCPIPVVALSIVNDAFVLFGVAALLALCSPGVTMFTERDQIEEAFKVLQQKGSFSIQKKRRKLTAKKK